MSIGGRPSDPTNSRGRAPSKDVFRWSREPCGCRPAAQAHSGGRKPLRPSVAQEWARACRKAALYL